MARRARRAGDRILVGTTSWTEKTLVTESDFYPASVKTAEGRLRHYASRFPIVEVDSTFYAIPAERNASLWTERTSPGFVFDVKAYRLFTQHRTPVTSLPADLRKALAASGSNVYYPKVPEEVRAELWRRFRAALEPLHASGRLGVVLFQFAPWLTFGDQALAHIGECASAMQGFRLAVELRNVSWLGPRHRDETLAFLRRHRLVHVVVDEPQDTSFSVPAVWQATSREVAVVRLHGRNRRNWSRKGLASASDRFAYQYSDEELSTFVSPVERLAESAREVHVLFNNCHLDWAQRNAARFAEMLAAAEGRAGLERMLLARRSDGDGRRAAGERLRGVGVPGAVREPARASPSGRPPRNERRRGGAGKARQGGGVDRRRGG